MLEHIVKANEGVDAILNAYHITLNELKKYNSHITDFSNLIGGIKLMIPVVNQEISQILDSTEGFVMEYYPKISDEIIPLLNRRPIVEKEKEENEKRIDAINDYKNSSSRIAYPGITPPKVPYKGRI